ncbi:DUF6531 domain-containing protein [Leptolyngbya sp. 7M]|uniref:DUF6531 domain-containing protein n=1 Tax=Leptolyngbya sp. 7M TaxID=2812896 RepID=UPI001B8C52DB|nr:DUF6531 domain-containing protein [Leptolyngbya sp. 7M]QYO65708.1 hypothetical protein JVX88_02650 [Leptolyngbya sp. 7M]
MLSSLGNAHDNDYDPDGDAIIGHYTHYWTEAAPVGRGYVGYLGGIAVVGGTVSGTFDIPYGITDNRGGHAYSSVTAHVTASGGAENAGRFCPSIGQPVNVTNGNMWVEHTDYDLPGIGERIEIRRFYNSMIQSSGMFGFGWSTKYDESLWIYGDRLLRLNLPDARAVYFGRRLTTDPFESLTFDFQGQIVKEADGTFLLTFKDGRTHKFDQTGRLLWQRDRNQNQTTLAYDVNGRLATVTDAFGRTLTFTMSANGYVEEISDALGSVATYEYFPGTGRLKTVTFADASKYKFEYNTTAVYGKVFLATVKDALDNILETHLYDSSGRATTSELQGGVEKYEFDYTNLTGSNPYTIVKHKKNSADPYIQTKFYFKSFRGRNEVTKTEGLCGCGSSGSEITENIFDTQARLTKTIDALGRETLYTYDNDRNIIQTVDDLGTQKWTYNAFGQVLTYKDRVDSQNSDPNVNTFTNTYNSNGDLLTATDALGNVTTFTYSMIGQPLTIKDARNKITTLTWDSSGRMTQIKDANNKTTSFAYDPRARVTSTTNALSQTTSFEYDLNNRLKKVIYPDTSFVENTYDIAGRRTAFRDARGNVTNFSYDGANRLTGITDPLGNSTTYGYDLMSNLISQTDALGNVTNLEYDDFNRLKKIIYPPATTGATRLEESMTYDLNGNIKTRIDTAGRTTTYDYDTSNRLIKITDALLNQTQFEYNLRSQLTKVKDALNQEYIYTYDPLGRALTQTRAGATMSFEYDAVGNRTKRTDYRGREATYSFDSLNRLTEISYSDGMGNPSPTSTATYGYDALSRLISATNGAGTVMLTYDNRGRLKTETDVFGHVTERAYDANSNRTQLKLNGDVHTAYAYDAANRLTTLTDDASQSFTYGYDIADRLISTVLPNGITSTFEYDGMSRLKKLKHQSASATLTENDFTYNAANQIGQIAELAQTRNSLTTTLIG